MSEKTKKKSPQQSPSDPLRSKAFLVKRGLLRCFRVYASANNYRVVKPRHLASISIARVIGNDLYPRHAGGQTIENLKFVLENEEEFPNCRKLFVINRMFVPEMERQAVELIEERGHVAQVLPFVHEDYAKRNFDMDILGEEPYPSDGSEIPLFTGPDAQRRLLACADKIRYAINVNGARNAALEHGRRLSEWTLLLDGSCFVPARAFEQLRRELFGWPFAPYLVVPMQRLQSNELALTKQPAPVTVEEPQIAFHRDSMESFDERYPYGMQDKTSLLNRLGVPGPWSHWKEWKELPRSTAKCPERHYYKYSKTSVFRLSSGVKGGYLESAEAQRERYQSRNKAIFQSLAMLDRQTRQVVKGESGLDQGAQQAHS